MSDFRAVCFDLDGTLLDTLEEIAVSANAVLAREGFPEHEIQSYRYHVGDGVRRLVERILPETNQTADEIDAFTQRLEAEYAIRANKLTRIYPGISELLDDLKAGEIPLAVLSNKPHSLTVDCMGRFFPKHSFHTIRGQQADTPRKPNPAGAHKIAESLDLPLSKILYVGDTDVDMQTAKAAGMVAVGVLWGFRNRDELLSNGADHIVEAPSNILSLIAPEGH